MQRRGWSVFLFLAIGFALYAGVYLAAERLTMATGRSNPFFKIATVPDRSFDWVILGASHAMPLDFVDFNLRMEGETGCRILNLAATGAGPLYNRFVLEHFLQQHRTRKVLYVVDSFAFYSRTWNEDRFGDAKLLRRMPFEPSVARRLWNYAREEGVDARVVLDYVSGFSKINNRERFQRDVWEGEAQFERASRPSKTAVAKRIEYLYPGQTPVAARARYLDELDSLIALAQRSGSAVVVIKMPVPAQFRGQLPDEAAFDAALATMLAGRAPLHDFSAIIDEPRFYFDTDHLNRAGLSAFFTRELRAILGACTPEEGRIAQGSAPR
ncbi:MAG TPA: hypothetical protein VFR86_14575 [Burkholderiaceae bacterium]|nr:hypothetical protein [Burkholderiaceae bacterium]